MCREEPMSTRNPKESQSLQYNINTALCSYVTLRLRSVVLIVNTLSTLAKGSVTDLLFLGSAKRKPNHALFSSSSFFLG